MRVLVLGASGMLGSALVGRFDKRNEITRVGGTFRPGSPVPAGMSSKTELVPVRDIFETDAVSGVMRDLRPDVTVNAIGIIKQLATPRSVDFIRVNSLLPHQLSDLAASHGSRFVEISTDCVFSGRTGMYTESAIPDATDIYGRSKLLGEVVGQDHAVTLRTSIIGHESGRNASLVDWFLSSSGVVQGYSNARFSGFPTTVLADVLVDHVFQDRDLTGLYHLSANPIDKYSLLQLLRSEYGKSTVIEPKAEPVIDRSLDSRVFREETGFSPKPWPDMIETMNRRRHDWTVL